MMAADRGNVDVVSALIEANADASRCVQPGQNALELCLRTLINTESERTRAGCERVVELLKACTRQPAAGPHNVFL